jgi:glutamate synthase (NADPH) small chain
MMAQKIGRKTKTPMPTVDPAARRHSFDEVACGYSVEMARQEAERCIECKNRPCVEGCPVDVDIPDFIRRVAEGDFRAAYETLSEKNLLPAICGRVCPQEDQCERRCTLGVRFEPVAIGRLERFVADYAACTQLAHTPVLPRPTGRTVAVVGSGPAGLTVAADLAKMGHGVTIFEALHEPGGVLIYGIPEFRLPKSIVEREIAKLEALGVTMKTNHVIGRTFTVDELFGELGFDAVFIGTGAGLPHFPNIAGVNLIGVYRRSLAEMPARAEEVEHAREEGVELLLLTAPVVLVGDERSRVQSMRCMKMALAEPDGSRRRRPVPLPGSEFDIEVDTVVFAVGQGANPLIRSTTPDLAVSRSGYVLADPTTGATAKEGVFAGGDIVTGSAPVISAMGAGRRAARAIDGYLRGRPPHASPESK